MRKITFLFVLSFTVSLGLTAQVVHTNFGSTTNDANTEWSGSNFGEFDLVSVDPYYGKVKTKSGGLGVATYTGTYSGTVSSTDVIYLRIRRQISGRSSRVEKFVVSYKQNGGATESTTLIMPDTNKVEDIVVTPGFIEGATLSDLSFTMTKDNGGAGYDVLFPYQFLIGEVPATLSLESNIIEGAKVFGKDGELIVVGAKLEAVYSITGQELRTTNLPTGVYIVKISKKGKVATVKVVL